MLNSFKSTKYYKIINRVVQSATLAFALSIIFFAVEIYKETNQEKHNQEHFEETVCKLDTIRQSLSTRFLGTFPNYLTEINRVLEHLEPQDTVVIFEDVLYYGIISRPLEFCRFTQSLVKHARENKGKVIIAYYNNYPGTFEPLWNSVFHRMVLESRVSAEYIPKIQQERQYRLREEMTNNQDWIKRAIQVDSLITEKYYRSTIDSDKLTAKKELDLYLTRMSDSQYEQFDYMLSRLCQQLDSIKQYHLGNGKRLEDIHFIDYKKMYSDMTDCIAKCYGDNGVELLPMNEYFTMSCWLVKPSRLTKTTEAILAFPSKYASDEIGFYSQDISFSNYITKMLQGARNGKIAQNSRVRRKE